MSAAIFLALLVVCNFVQVPVNGKPVVTSESEDLPVVPPASQRADQTFRVESSSSEARFDADEYYVVGDARVKRQAVMNKTRIWPGGIVPYVLDKAFTPDVVATIEATMREIEQNVGNSTHPCIKFVPRTTEVNYLDARDGNGCSSVIGLDYTGPQVSIFAPLCAIKGLLLHELLHTLGIYHEQDRFDRDEFISINATNLLPNAERNYILKNVSDIDILGTSYDFTSIMHYGPYSFPKDPQYPVMTPKPKYATGTYMGQRSALSASDVLRVQRLYKCPEDTSHMQSDITEDKILLWCDFENGTCDFNVSTNLPGVPPEAQGNKSGASSSETAERVYWMTTAGPTQDGPRSGTTNGLDAFFYASRKISEDNVQNSREPGVFPVDTTASAQPFTKSSGPPESGSLLDISTETLLHKTLEVPLISHPPIQDSSVPNSWTRESSVSERLSQESSTSNAETPELAATATSTVEPSLSDTPIQETQVSNAWTQESPTKTATAPPPPTPTDKVTVSLTTPILNTGDMCIDLRFHQGSPGSFLEIYIKGPLFKRGLIYTMEGSYLNQWMTLKLSLPMKQGPDFQLEFASVLGPGSVALDDVHILKGLCL